MKKWLLGAASIVGLALIGAALYLKTPAPIAFDAEAAVQQAAQYDARIIRDTYGVPHIFGKTDADASFGFGYAHAEDDWETIQDVIIGARGMTSQFKGKGSAPQDFLYDLFKVQNTLETEIGRISPEARAMARGYADALNLWGAHNPERVKAGILPVRESDVHNGMTWASPFFYRLDETLAELFTAESKPDVSPWSQTSSLNLPSLEMAANLRGSNAFAVAPARSDDGHTRLFVNSHQPMKGPYAWYEAHMVSEEGLNITGGTFPGVPLIPQGVTPNLGWTHTVNRPDLTDIYELEVDNKKTPKRYKLDGQWRDFETGKSKFRVKLFGPFSLPVTRTTLWSEHGPVLSTETGHYAIKFAGLQTMGSLEQWYRMSKAQNMQQWRKALEINGVLSFNIVYGDKDGNIGHVYNARMPERIEGPDWEKVLPGDKSDLIWTDYRAPTDLPQIWNPDCGWVFSANATPFMLTDPRCDLKREDYSKTFGLEPRITNRARRAVAQYSADNSISRDEFIAYRADTKYDPQSNLMQLVVELVSQEYDEDILNEAKEVLRHWDGDARFDSRGAALAIITGTRAMGYEINKPEMDPVEALRETAQDLQNAFGRVDPQWREVMRLQHGSADLPLEGGPDVLRAIYADRDGVKKTGTLNAFAGDTHIMLADWDEAGRLILDSIHQYGAATLDETSPHYADQAALFATGEFKPMPVTLEQVLKVAKRDYRPNKR